MSSTTVHKGLAGIAAAETEISLVDGEHGRLVYRGYSAKDLALHHSYEDVLHLLWYGALPSHTERERLAQTLQAYRTLPQPAADVLQALPGELGMMSVLRTVVSALERVEETWPPTVDQAAWVTAKIPTIIAARHRLLHGLAPLAPADALGHAENFLYLLTGDKPSHAHVRTLDAYLVLTAEHGLSASTFAARVTLSTESDLVSAVTSAIGAMKGPLHGGAPAKVGDLLAAIGTKENAEGHLRALLERGERIMGFGHREYKVRDPRAEALAAVVRDLSGEDPWLDLAAHVEEVAIRLLAEYKPGRNLFTNVEFYAAAVLRALALPKELYTPTFSLARVGGWTAHILEQACENRIIRPQAVYRGVIPGD